MEENKIVEQATEETVVEEKATDIKSVEERLQALLVENAKLKKATDKATAEASSFKKQLREKQTADEIAMAEKAEKQAQMEEELNLLRRESSVNKFAKTYLTLGYTEEQAIRSANAQIDGDTETLLAVQTEVQKALRKQFESEFIANRQPVNAGFGGNQATTITKEQFENMGYLELKKFKEENPEEYKKLMNN